MINMTLQQSEALTGGTLIGKAIRFNGVSIDSREDCEGQLFIGLNGARFKGADFCHQAVANGAVAILVDSPQDIQVPQIVCANTQSALAALAQGWLQQTGAKVLAITGSNGKTTVKNMLKSVVSRQYSCHATQGNLNNEIGVPLTILQATEGTEYIILEMGAAQIGDIAYLTSIAKPYAALVNNVSDAHVGRFGSLENIAQGKAEIYSMQDSSGIAVINSNISYATDWIKQAKAKVVTFGEQQDDDFQIKEKSNESFIIHLANDETACIKLPVMAEHTIWNATAVFALASSIGVEHSNIVLGLESYRPEPGRLEELQPIRGVQVINDTYNANPTSVQVAIDVLVKRDKPILLVLGDMMELGEKSHAYHEQVIAYAEEKGVDQIVTIGQQMAQAKGNKIALKDQSELIKWLKKHWSEYSSVLIKGSRSMGLEKVVNELTAWGKAA